MRQLSFFFLIIITIHFSACQKGRPVDINFRAYITIPPGLNTGLSHHFSFRDIPGVSTENYARLIDAQPAYVTLTIEYGEQDLNFVYQAFLYTKKDAVKQEAAYQTDIPMTNYSSIQLYPSILNMKDHIRQELFDMELKLIFRAIPVTETRIRIDFGVQGRLDD